MVSSSRGILAIGLSLTGLALLVGPSLGQPQDPAVRKTATPTAKATVPQAPVAPVIGTVDIETVFNSYEKVKASNEEFRAAMMVRKNELMKIMADAQSEADMLAKLTPGTDDYKKHENRVTELKARHEAGREQAEREFTQRQAESMATLYKEVQSMVGKVAKWRKMNYIVKVSNQPISGANPNSVMAAIANTVVYAEGYNDITNDVIHNLNKFYRAALGPTKAPTAVPGADAAVSGGQPRENN
jgi:outer membrane protein